jgi:dipeptidyl aminopeptidase/acylaminoacyl peptidase
MKIIKILPLLLLITLPVIAQNNPASKEKDDSLKISINRWLLAGAFPLEMPVETDTGKQKFKEKDLLNFEPVDIYRLKPKEGDLWEWNNNIKTNWETENEALPELDPEDDSVPEIYYAVTYITAARWINAKLELKSCHMLKAYIDGKEILFKASTQAEKNDKDCKPEKATKNIELETGAHTLVVKSLKNPRVESDWNLSAVIILDSSHSTNDISVSTDIVEYATVERLLEDPKIGDVSISADGEYAAVRVSEIPFGKDSKETWINVYKTSNGSLFRSFKGGMAVTSIKWMPSGHRFSYTTSEKSETTIWLFDPDKGTNELILRGENISDYNWSPDESYIIYYITEKASENKTGIKLITGMDKRLPGSDDRYFMYRITYPGKIKTRLTAGTKNLYLNAISNNSKKLLLSVSDTNWVKRPYSFTTYYLLDLSSMKLDSLKSFDWPGSAQFSPDDEKILFTGGPSMFGSTGRNVRDGLIPNEYDTQAYIYDIQSGEAESITRNFNPSIESAYWSRTEPAIYFNTIDMSFQHLYRYDTETKTIKLIKLKADVLDEIEFAEKSDEAVYRGSSAVVPDKFYYINLKNGNSKLLFDPSEESYRNVKNASAEVFTFKNARGEDIDGMVIYPPNFDKNKKYPAIINYYGGTSPIEQAFEGRYPKNIWAANGYVVYILEPSGSVGYGQNFSAYHVNDWGNTTAQEIIDGTRAFLKAHPFVDSTRIGCIGASYGGFMTMNLLTKTNMFTAGISHAGISNLANYWGAGYWGYSYSAVATANSFPWNRKDIYVDFSPLFNADKINTPILLLHGAADTNVPPGESTQMFTALKLLGKDVTYIQVADQDHHILEYKKRKLWTKTIIAYFDKYLKKQPQWWDSLYPAEEKNSD